MARGPCTDADSVPEFIPEGIRNNTLTSIGGRLRWQGYERKQIERTLLKINDARCVPPLPRPEVYAIAKSVSRYKPGNNRNAIPREDFVANERRLFELAELAEAYHWQKRNATPTTQRAVYVALLRIAYLSGRRLVFQASERQIAEEAGISSRKALRRALSDLRAFELIDKAKDAERPIEAHKPTKATVWRLPRMHAQVRQKRPNKTREVTPKALLGSFCRSLNADVWRNGIGLGKTGQRVYGFLTTEPVSVRELTGDAGMVKRTVERRLERLAAVGLARKTAAGWIRTDLSPDDACPERARGALERQKIDHIREREAFQEAREAFQAKVEKRRRRRLVVVSRDGPGRVPRPTASLLVREVPRDRMSAVDLAARRALLAEQARYVIAREAAGML